MWSKLRSPGYLGRIGLVLALCAGIGCNSTVGGGQVKAASINERLGNVRSEIIASNLPSEAKARIAKSLNAAQSEITELGKASDHNQSLAEKYKSDSATLYALYAAGFGIALIFLAMRFRPH
jgi:uncharacterized protein HemX